MSSVHQKVRFAVGIIYCLFFIYLLFFASFREGTNTEVNLIPFQTVYNDIRLFFTASPSANYIVFTLGGILGNFLLLLPIPVLFKLNQKGLRKWTLLLLIPICIEGTQYFFQVGSADIDDVIFNALGFSTGFWLRKKGI